MTTNQLTTYHGKDRTTQKERVLSVIQQQPGITPQQIEKVTGIVPGTISARINDLEREGKVYRVDGDESYLYFEADPEKQKQRADRFATSKALEQFASSMRKLIPFVSKEEVEVMRGIYSGVRKKL